MKLLRSSRSPAYVLLSLLAGLATTALLWRAEIGLSWLVTVSVFVGGLFAVHRRTMLTGLAGLWGAAAIWLALCMCWRASTWTLAIAYPASLFMVLTLPLVVHRRLRYADLGDLPALALTWLTAALPACADAGRLLLPRDERVGRRVLGGLALGLPVSLTIGALLSADSRFRTAISDIVSHGSDAWIFGWWTLATIAAFLVGPLALTRMDRRVFAVLRHPALLGRVVAQPSPAPTAAESPYRSSEHTGDSVQGEPRLISPLTWTLVLSQLVVLFGLFVAVNRDDFFGGHALVRSQGTTTYAAYLHAGFAEVTVATGLTVAIVMLGHVIVGVPSRRRQKWAFAALEVLLLALAAVTLASCWHRIAIYMDAYGYTHARLGVVFAQLGLLGLLSLTVIRAVRRSWTGQGACVVALPLVLALGAATFNADLFVARANLRRLVSAPETATSTGLDTQYLSDLSSDALAALDDEHVPVALAVQLRTVWTKRGQWLRTGDWRGWRALGLDVPEINSASTSPPRLH